MKSYSTLIIAIYSIPTILEVVVREQVPVLRALVTGPRNGP